MRTGPSELRGEMQAAQQVHEQVARDAGAVVAVIAPAEQADRLERAFRCAAQEAVPIDVRGRGIGRDRVLPRADCGIPVEPRFHHVQLADGAGFQQLLGFLIHQRTHVLAAHLKHLAAALLGGDHALAFLHHLHHRLLAVHVLAGIERIGRNLRVPVIGGGDNDGVDIFARQHLPVIARGEELASPVLFGAREPAVVDIAHGHEFHAGNRERVPGVARSHAARSDQSDADAVVGGYPGLLRGGAGGHRGG